MTNKTCSTLEPDTVTTPNVVSNAVAPVKSFFDKLTRKGHAPRRHKSPLDLAWSRFQDYSQILMLFGIAITLLYIFWIAIPVMIENKSGAPFFPSLPKVNSIILFVHAVLAVPPLIIGMPAFSRHIRNASLKVHRWIGTTYCICIWISALLGIMLAVANPYGPFARLGFSMLGIVWFTTTWLAYKTGRNRDIVSHRRWMIRSYAVTLAVVSIRPMFWFGPLWGLDYQTWYILCTWMCWVPNLIIGEIYMRVTKPNGHLQYG